LQPGLVVVAVTFQSTTSSISTSISSSPPKQELVVAPAPDLQVVPGQDGEVLPRRVGGHAENAGRVPDAVPLPHR